jgi:hypothetical protein
MPILPEHSIAEVSAEHVMAVLDLIDDGEELAAVVAPKARAEHLGDLVRSQAPQAKFTASLEQLVDGKVESPRGWPQSEPRSWYQLHDEYDGLTE